MLKKMLITGAGGMVGRQAAEYFRKQYRVTALSRTSLSITDEKALERVFLTVEPDIVFNCAVIRNGRYLQNAQFVKEVNANGVRNLAVCCRKFDAVLVQLSTDYVFEGNTGSDYTEETVPNPLSLYGCTKRAGEQFALEENQNTFVVRTGWLYGRYGDNFVHKILRRVQSGQEIDILSGQYGNPTSVEELLCMTSNLLQTQAYGIYHAVCKGRTSRLAFAKQIVHETGLVVPIREISRSEPFFDTSLSTEKLQQTTQYMPVSWTKALENYFDEVQYEDFIQCTKRCPEN